MPVPADPLVRFRCFRRAGRPGTALARTRGDTWCSVCGRRHQIDDAIIATFGSAEWEATEDPATLAACLRELVITPTARKDRLLACGVARLAHSDCRFDWFRDALEWGRTRPTGFTGAAPG